MEYLDKEGGKYLTTKLKSYVDNKVTHIPSGGTVDLTNYYTKEETDQLLANLPSGGKGDKGDKGDAGVGVSSIRLVNYELIITLTDGTVHNLGNVRGEKGAKGAKGDKGDRGDNGTNGVSPTVSVTKEGKVATITCTDVNGTTTATISDGADGASGGSSSGGGSSITYAYDTEIATGETWVDGKPIYLKVFHINGSSSQPSSSIIFSSYKEQNKFAETIVSVIPVWKGGNRVITGNIVDISDMVSTVTGANENIVQRALNCWVDNDAKFSIGISKGKRMYSYGCDVFVKYTKL